MNRECTIAFREWLMRSFAKESRRAGMPVFANRMVIASVGRKELIVTETAIVLLHVGTVVPAL